MEFISSKSELHRRKKAFITLLLSLTAGLFLSSKILDFPISPTGYLFLVVAFISAGVLTVRFLNSVSRIKIHIGDKKIERTNGRLSENFSLSDINRITIKKRTTGSIREMYIWFRNRNSLVMTAFEEDFAQVKDALVGNTISKNVVVKEVREPIDFDHPLFYPILGLLIGFVSIYFLKLITNIDYSVAAIILLISSMYTFALSVYFMLIKPIARRCGGKQAVVDYVIGLIMVCAGIFILLTGLSL